MTIFDKVDEILKIQNKSIFSTSEIKDLCHDHYGINKNSVIPSDYCYNRTNHGIANDKNILIFLGAGEYKYVGRDHQYSGWVYHKEKGETKEKIVGEWKNGKYIDFDQALTYEEHDTDHGAEPTSNVSGLSKDRLEELYSNYLGLLELEISILGCKATEVRHLIGRIGEFKCAMETNGTLAAVPNQHGFDVISEHGKRISVKTTAQVSGFVSINSNTLDRVDELMVIQYKANKFSIVYHGSVTKAIEVSRLYSHRYELDISKAVLL
ncbi:conserved hypothetical protein [Desulfamplus magnetovallimortis]|uniref:Restriction endonuclease n=1 Tax=Desulfamplus magnetovallimortis TaxID=1246637 RepID=A0A1W1HD44_9BACT|nr:hypothetical protein [Desulfamplus magnetovallimortis]SLM30421.1 conserved hypothetical protein [Desulfamplus magnetovallimortis]